jgi:hypothetical protein
MLKGVKRESSNHFREPSGTPGEPREEGYINVLKIFTRTE